MVCIPHQILLGWHVKKHEIWRGGCMRHIQGRGNIQAHTVFCWEGGGGTENGSTMFYEVRVKFQASPRRDLWWTKWQRVFSEYFGLPRQ